MAAITTSTVETAIAGAFPPTARQLTRLIWAIAMLLALATPLTIAASGPGVLPGDVAISNAVHQTLPAWMDGSVAVANLLGQAPVAIGLSVLLAMLLFARQWRSEATLVAAAAIAWAGNAVLKALAESPRPTASLVRITENATGFGFPSGHVMGITVLFGALLLIATHRLDSTPLRRLAQFSALSTLALTGIARIEVGAHWPSDVLGGYLWGTILLLAIVMVQAGWSGVVSTITTIATRIPIPRRQATLID